MGEKNGRKWEKNGPTHTDEGWPRRRRALPHQKTQKQNRVSQFFTRWRFAMASAALDVRSCVGSCRPYAPPAHPASRLRWRCGRANLRRAKATDPDVADAAPSAVEAEQPEMACYGTGQEVECILPDGAVPSTSGREDQGGPAGQPGGPPRSAAAGVRPPPSPPQGRWVRCWTACCWFRRSSSGGHRWWR
jgi:hypothetical protein